MHGEDEFLLSLGLELIEGYRLYLANEEMMLLVIEALAVQLKDFFWRVLAEAIILFEQLLAKGRDVALGDLG